MGQASSRAQLYLRETKIKVRERERERKKISKAFVGVCLFLCMCVVFLSIDIYNSRLVSDNKDLNTERKEARKRGKKNRTMYVFFCLVLPIIIA